jgi:hypothetical protein
MLKKALQEDQDVQLSDQSVRNILKHELHFSFRKLQRLEIHCNTSKSKQKR